MFTGIGLARDKTFDEILRTYTFVADFAQKSPTRKNSEEIFWRYPFKVPEASFPIEYGFDDPKREFPATVGSGMAVTHMNKGRMLFLNKEFERAKSTFLSARARYGKEFKQHRRNDYLIGQSFLELGKSARDAGKGWSDSMVQNHFSNAATFYAWAFLLKVDHKDKLVDDLMPKGLYNLSAIYWRFKRYSGAYASAQKGLDFLRKTGRKDYRARFNRIIAEAFVRNRTYLDAVRFFDKAIRQDPNPREAAAMFTRVGDIYFDLNNYELAEDSYKFGELIDREQRQITPYQMVLRGESLFWMGKFSDSQKIMNYALQGGALNQVDSPLDRESSAFASLRIADGFLALKKFDKARLEYYKVIHENKGTQAESIAKIRSACLELPYYRGNNIRHARELLDEMKTSIEVPSVAYEIAWACHVNSYTDRERTENMLKRVASFADSYPDSRFLKSMVKPVKEYQASKVFTYFEKGDIYNGISFFETNRKLLYPKVNKKLGRYLYEAYIDVHQSEKAREFWAHRPKSGFTDLDRLREAVMVSETAHKHRGDFWVSKSKTLGLQLIKRKWELKPDEPVRAYIQRIRVTHTAPSHLPWIYKLADHWSEKSSELMCNLQYPLLSEMVVTQAMSTSLARKEVEKLILRSMPGLLRLDESCAVSLLDIEVKLMGDDTRGIASLYLARNGWPMQGAFMRSTWTIAERLKQEGHDKEARQLWTLIRDKGKKGSPEVGFSIARLDPRRTEFDQLWD
jgi:tetratricopeptide (TPR) repeat protein